VHRNWLLAELIFQDHCDQKSGLFQDRCANSGLFRVWFFFLHFSGLFRTCGNPAIDSIEWCHIQRLWVLTRYLFWPTRCCRVPLILKLLLWLTVGRSWLVNRAVRPERFCIFCRTYTSVESLTTKTAGPLKRPSLLTIASLHDVTGLVASCYKSHRLYLVCDHYTIWFYYTTSMCRLKFFHYSVETPYWLSSRDVIL